MGRTDCNLKIRTFRIDHQCNEASRRRREGGGRRGGGGGLGGRSGRGGGRRRGGEGGRGSEKKKEKSMGAQSVQAGAGKVAHMERAWQLRAPPP